ncbi:hypothetical protein SEVIR_7G273900v4 [Setaria viridis]|uniref:Uncharacterized protein n=1 Tax=Setaria viridis TaxID=4556 RepID=A0A4U6TV10_SETVI|nr:uncharacterized protein LOC117865074 [Setaria viridis]TKW06938.1 hypothetical protein SEVIR_7G273900v2 [Setaria viridis]
MFTDGMSRLAVAVSVTVALSLAIFLTILVLLLADLFCAHLRRRRLRAEASQSKLGPLSLSPARTEDGSVATTAAAREALSGTPPFYYAHGVLHAPNTKDLLLAIPKLESAVWRWSPARRSTPSRSGSSTGSSARGDGFMCISNPVYDRGGARGQAAPDGGDSPPFETPGASPSPFGITEEGDEEEGGFSPPLSAMRRLPPVGVVAYPPPSLSFADARPALTVTDTNRASSSSSSNLTAAHFFSSWSSK